MTAGRTNVTNVVDWNTPPVYVDAVLRVLGQVDLDPCSNGHSLVPATHTYQLPVDGLEETWDYPRIFVNPPYGRDSVRKTSMMSWVSKAADAHERFGSEILMLIPVATNTRHFKDIIFTKFTAICFLADTRLKFYVDGEEHTKGAPMACCMVYVGDALDKFTEVFSEFGTVFPIASSISSEIQ